MNLTLPPGASAFRKTLVAFIEQHWSESELADLSRPVSPNRKLFLQKKLDEWYNKIFDEDWGSAGLNEYLLGGNLGSTQWYVWVSECGSRNLPSPLKLPGVGIVAPIVLALGSDKLIESVLPGIRNNEVAWGLAFSGSWQNQGDLKLKTSPSGIFLSGRVVVAHMGEKSDWVLIIHSEDGARNLLFVETSRLSFESLSDDVGLAFTSFSELVFDGERIDEQQVFEISSAPDWEKVLDYSINNYLFYQSPLYLRQETKKLKDLYRLGEEIEGIDRRFSEIEIEIEALVVSEIRMMSKSKTIERGLVIGQLSSRITDLLIEFQQLEVDLAAYNVVAGESSLLTHNEPESRKKDAAHLVNKMLYINTWSEGLMSRSSIRDHLAGEVGMGRYF